MADDGRDAMPIDWLDYSDLSLLFRDWQSPDQSYYTYHPVFIPPVTRFESLAEAQEWARTTIGVLTTPDPASNGRCPIECPPGNNPASHLVLVQGSEFMFNKFATDDGKWTADASKPVQYEFFQAALKDLYDAIRRPEFAASTIVLGLAAVVDYGPCPHPRRGGRGDLRMAENAAFVVNNRAAGFQKISKWKASSLDHWDYSRYFDFNGERQAPRSVMTPERVQDHTHSIHNFGAEGETLAIGFGLCLDSQFAEYPGTSIVCFFAGWMSRQRVNEKSLGSFVVCDTAHFQKREGAGRGVGEYFTSQPVRLGSTRMTREEQGRFQMYKQAMLASGQFDSPESRAWLEKAQVVPPSWQDATAFNELVGVSWPLSMKETGVWYRQGDYTPIHEGIMVGTSRKLPRKPMKLNAGAAVLAPMQMHQFVDEDEFERVREVIDAEAIRLGRDNDVEAREIYDLYQSAKTDARANGRELGGWEWEARVAKNIEDRARIPDDLPVDGGDVEEGAGGEAGRGEEGERDGDAAERAGEAEARREEERERAERDREAREREEREREARDHLRP